MKAIPRGENWKKKVFTQDRKQIEVVHHDRVLIAASRLPMAEKLNLGNPSQLHTSKKGNFIIFKMDCYKIALDIECNLLKRKEKNK